MFLKIKNKNKKAKIEAEMKLNYYGKVREAPGCR